MLGDVVLVKGTWFIRLTFEKLKRKYIFLSWIRDFFFFGIYDLISISILIKIKNKKFLEIKTWFTYQNIYILCLHKNF